MYGCCIRVTALLECFEWTLNKLHNMTTGNDFSMPLLMMLSMPSGWGMIFGITSFYYDLIIKGVSPCTQSLFVLIKGYDHCASSTFKTNK